MSYGTGRGARALGVLMVAAALAGALSWRVSHKRPSFPRPGQAALSGPALDKAFSRAQAALEKSPDDLESRIDLGILYANRGGDAAVDAINELEAARDLGATDPEIPFYLGSLYQAEGLPDFAIREFSRYLRTHPGNKETELLVAKLYYQTGRPAEAAKRYEKLAARYPSDPIVLENLGLSLAAARDLTRAKEVFAKLQQGGGDPARRAWYYSGNVALTAKEFRSALTAYSRSLPMGDEPPAGLSAAQIFAGIALAAEGLGRFDLARKGWERVLGVDPDSLQAQAKLLELRVPSSASWAPSPASGRRERLPKGLALELKKPTKRPS